MADPAERDRISATMTVTLADPEIRRGRGLRTRAAWQDPEKSSRMRNRLHLAHLTDRQRLTYDFCRDIGLSIVVSLATAARAPAE